MKIALTMLSTKDLATLAQRIISNTQPGKDPKILPQSAYHNERGAGMGAFLQ